jgi:hypothetical protein
VNPFRPALPAAVLLFLLSATVAGAGAAATPDASCLDTAPEPGSRLLATVSQTAPAAYTVIVASPEDPYHALAEEIAQTEGVAMADSVEDAVSLNPAFVLWVVSPEHLSDQTFASLGRAMLERPTAISLGIISGSTLERARELWRRAGLVKGERVFAVNAANPSASIFEGRIIAFDDDGDQITPFTKTNLQRVLSEADYLSFTGHGSSGYLRLNDDVVLVAADIPSLRPATISTGSCKTFQPWRDESIALRLVDQGAAAYSGFVWSPNEGYLIGEFSDLPFRYSWPGFPIGHIVQAQNQGTLQGFASLPYYYLLGDPRIALQRVAPYSVEDDRVEGHTRIVDYAAVPAGLIPIRIPNAASYAFVEAPGVTAAWESDPFYNSRLQMVDIGSDKYVLLVHTGGDFSLRLRTSPPWYWVIADAVLDSLDHALLFSRQSGGSVVLLGAALGPLIVVCVLLARKRASAPLLTPAALVGLCFAALEGAYSLLRLGKLTITSKPVGFTPLGLFASFLLTACGAFLFLQARSTPGRTVGLLVSALEGWAQAILLLGILALVNLANANGPQGVGCWNYALGLMSLVFAVLHGVSRLVLLSLVRRKIKYSGAPHLA